MWRDRTRVSRACTSLIPKPARIELMARIDDKLVRLIMRPPRYQASYRKPEACGILLESMQVYTD